MARELAVMVRVHDSGLYNLDEGVNYPTERVWDISSDCPKLNNRDIVLLLLIKAKFDHVVRIVHFNNQGIIFCTYFFVKNLILYQRDDASLAKSFSFTASQLGLSRLQLKTLITKQISS